VILAADQLAGGRPVLQVAVDGWWERATQVPLPARPPALAPQAGDVAVEVLWPGRPIVFVGARYAHGEVPPLTQLSARDDWSPSKALAVLAGGALGPPVRAEVGAVNAWRSVGPLVVGLGDDEPAVAAALASRPDLASCGHPLALEVAVVAPREAWWAIECGADAADVAGLLALARG
jgi:hypothetical protein